MKRCLRTSWGKLEYPTLSQPESRIAEQVINAEELQKLSIFGELGLRLEHRVTQPRALSREKLRQKRPVIPVRRTVQAQSRRNDSQTIDEMKRLASRHVVA